jgi:hypothetical protein
LWMIQTQTINKVKMARDLEKQERMKCPRKQRVTVKSQAVRKNLGSLAPIKYSKCTRRSHLARIKRKPRNQLLEGKMNLVSLNLSRSQRSKTKEKLKWISSM